MEDNNENYKFTIHCPYVVVNFLFLKQNQSFILSSDVCNCVLEI